MFALDHHSPQKILFIFFSLVTSTEKGEPQESSSEHRGLTGYRGGGATMFEIDHNSPHPQKILFIFFSLVTSTETGEPLEA